MKDTYTVAKIVELEEKVKSKKDFDKLSSIDKFALADNYLFRYSLSDDAYVRGNSDMAEALSDWLNTFWTKALPKVCPFAETNVKRLDHIINEPLPIDSDPWQFSDIETGPVKED